MPLGGADSYCYNGNDGRLVHNRQNIEGHWPGDTFQVGDVIGVYFHMEPPLPISDKSHSNYANLGSKLIFYKNGKEIACLSDITQGYYVFGVSLYEWANIEFN